MRVSDAGVLQLCEGAGGGLHPRERPPRAARTNAHGEPGVCDVYGYEREGASGPRGAPQEDAHL
eukprot:915184-Pyramimonas_sp.AAC.2